MWEEIGTELTEITEIGKEITEITEITESEAQTKFQENTNLQKNDDGNECGMKLMTQDIDPCPLLMAT